MNQGIREVIIIPGTGLYERAKRQNRQLRVASYSRVSTDMEEQLTSFHAQKATYTEKILRNPNWTLAGTYDDEGISGASAEKRPGFMKMMRHCKKGKIDLIITKSISRFARNTVDSIQYVRKLKAMGVGVMFEKEGLNTLEENSEMLLTIFSSFAQEELHSLSMNVKMGIRMGMKNGKVSYHYKTWYGYCEGIDEQPEIVHGEARVVQRIFEYYLAGDTPPKIGKRLNQEEIPYVNGRKWSKDHINSILKNEKYCGDVILQKTYVVDPISKKVEVNNGELPKIYIKNNHPAVVSREIFEQAQTERARRRNRPKVSKSARTEKGKYSSRYALTEILICGHCGTPYRRVVWTKHGGEKQPIWRCINRLDYGTKYCQDSVNVDEESLHKTIMSAILSTYTMDKNAPNELADVIRGALWTANEKVDVYEMETKIAMLLHETMEMIKQNQSYTSEFERAQTERKMKEMSEECKRLQKLVNEQKRSTMTEASIERTVNAITQHLERQPEELYTYNDSLVRQIIDTIRVMDENKLIIYFKNGTVVEKEMQLKVRKQKK